MSRISGSPADTLSLTLTSTSAITSMTGAAILIAPEEGSTRPGATVCQRLSSAASGRGARPASCAPILAASAANANTRATAPRAADLLFEGVMLFGVIMDCAIACVFFERRTVARFADDASIFDVNHSVGEAQYTRVVCDDQHSARGILGDPGQQRHDRIAVLSVEGSRGLVRENGRWSSHDGPCDGDPLLFAAAELECHDIDGLDDGVGHHVNTIPGSMRVTCTIAPILVGVLLVAKRSRR